MRAETELFKDKIEVSLDGRQIFYLFFGGAVIASLVFVLGVMVGKRVEARAHADGPLATSAARDPLAALDQLSQRDDLTFPTVLATSASNVSGVHDAVADEAETRTHDVRPGKDDPAAMAKPAAAAPAAAKPDKARADRPAEPGKAKEPQARQAAAEQAKANGAAEPSAAMAGRPELQAAADKDDQALAESPRFTLQLSSFRDRAEADAFFGKLKQAGFTPYVVEAEVPGKGTWYRVRLGHYDSYEAAIDAKKDFESSQRIIAYVTRLRS